MNAACHSLCRPTISSATTLRAPAARPNRVCLAKDEIWSAAACNPPREILCEAGHVWITQTGDPRDILLRAGERHLCHPLGTVVVQALCVATISLYS